MAKMFPSKTPSPTKSGAEVMLYNEFKKQLSDDYTVIHSVPWLKPAMKSVVETNYQKYIPTGEVDFLILHVELGVLAIEVKEGKYKYEDHSFFSITRNEKADVVGQIRDNSHGLSRWIGEVPQFRIKHGYAVAFPDSSFVNKSLPPAFQDAPNIDANKIVIGIEDIPALGKKIFDLMSYWKSALKTPHLGENRLQGIVDLLVHDSDYSPSWQTRISFDNKMWLSLTEQQASCLDRFELAHRMVVRGWPGTGKTLLAIETVKRLVARQEKVLVVTYNVHMAKYIRQQLSEQIEVADVFNFHDLCRKVAVAIGETTGTESIEYASLLQAGFAANYFSQYHAIVIDEGQALSEEWHIALAAGFASRRSIVFCDDAQVFGFESGTDSRTICRIYQSKEPFVLTHCLRSPKSINDKLQEITPPDFEVHCPRPFEIDTLTEIVTDDPCEHLREIVRSLLKDEELSIEDIVIIYPFWDTENLFEKGDPYQKILRVNAAKYRGLEAPIVIFFSEDVLPDDAIIFSAYSRATSKCIAIFGYEAVCSPKKNSYVSKVADRFRNLMESIRISRSVSEQFHQLGEVTRKLETATANIYWIESWNSWIVEISKENPAGKLWVDYLSTLQWPVFYWIEQEDADAKMRPENQKLYEDESSGGTYDFQGCEACERITPHKRVIGLPICFLCERPSFLSILDTPNSRYFEDIVSFDKTITQVMEGMKIVNPKLPISLVAMGMVMLSAQKHDSGFEGMLSDGGKMAYRAAFAIVAATVAIKKKEQHSLKDLVKRYYEKYESLSKNGITIEIWHQAMANAVSTHHRRGRISKIPIKKGYFVGSD